ncbi:hypothetical protein H0H93_014806 [Arthromyces matolae]|nr:hypothetical protein H0H93_014806 [Arthromyces matolae]
MFDDVGGQPLPCSPPDSIAQNTNLLDAYSKLSDLDEQLRQQTAHSEEPLIHVRILGYFMIYSPTAQGREFVASTVLECDDDEAIIKQGEVFLKYIIRAFRKYKGRTPDSSFSTVDALESTKDAIKALLKEGSRSHKQAKKLLQRSLHGFSTGVHGEYHVIPKHLGDAFGEASKDAVVESSRGEGQLLSLLNEGSDDAGVAMALRIIEKVSLIPR